MPLQRPRYLGFSKNRDLAATKTHLAQLVLPSFETGVRAVARGIVIKNRASRDLACFDVERQEAADEKDSQAVPEKRNQPEESAFRMDEYG
jgi:predicted rRNA methylase YqxC with S4 and FtsJ domains